MWVWEGSGRAGRFKGGKLMGHSRRMGIREGILALESWVMMGLKEGLSQLFRQPVSLYSHLRPPHSLHVLPNSKLKVIDDSCLSSTLRFLQLFGNRDIRPFLNFLQDTL